MSRLLGSPSLTHPNVANDIFTKKKPVPGTYKVQQLGDLIVTNVRGSVLRNLSVLEKAALRDIPKDMPDTHFHIYKLIGTYAPILDRMFFFGLVSQHVHKISVFDHTKCPKIQTLQYSNGYYKPDLEKIFVRRYQLQSCGTLAQQYISVLFHEMLHVFLWKYHCTCQECMFEEPAMFGIRGHGLAWAVPLKAILKAFERDLGWKMDGGLTGGISTDMAAGTLFTDQEILMLGLRREYKHPFFKVWYLDETIPAQMCGAEGQSYDPLPNEVLTFMDSLATLKYQWNTDDNCFRENEKALKAAIAEVVEEERQRGVAQRSSAGDQGGLANDNPSTDKNEPMEDITSSLSAVSLNSGFTQTCENSPADGNPLTGRDDPIEGISSSLSALSLNSESISQN